MTFGFIAADTVTQDSERDTLRDFLRFRGQLVL
jgi:hypothetical protein